MPKTIPNSEPALNHKQKSFVQAYAAGQNAYDAACHAGYSQQNAKTTARRLLQNPEIQAALQNLQTVQSASKTVKSPALDEDAPQTKSAKKKPKRQKRKALPENDITPEDVVRELAAIGFTTMNDICSWSDDGINLHHSDDISDAAAAAIAEVRESGTARGGVQVKLHPKLRALEMLGRHLGMFSPQVGTGQNMQNSMAFEAAQALFDDKNNVLPEAILQRLNAVYGQNKNLQQHSLDDVKICNTDNFDDSFDNDYE